MATTVNNNFTNGQILNASDINATNTAITELLAENRLIGGSQTATSTEDGGTNVFTFTLKDGTKSTFSVKNGSKGDTGATGPAGTNGNNGVSCTHSWNGTTLTVTSASGTSSANLKGEKGDTGAAGKNGSNGTNGTNGTSSVWFTGTAVSGTATTATAFTVSGSKAGDMYLNTSNYNTYRASAANSWVYVCNIKGATGAKGDTGAAGSNGSNGATPTIKISPGTNIGSVGTPSVTASTSGTTTTFTFNYLKGATGSKGDKGDTGPQGPQGPSGATAAVATESANGLMSAEDKKRVNLIWKDSYGSVSATDIINEQAKYVDLGLAGVWSKYNIGATSETDYGDYYLWGAMDVYAKTYPSSNYYQGSTDLPKENDIIRVKTFGIGRMPTKEDWKKLYDNTICTWVTINGVNGRKFVSKTNSSKYIFLPAAGLYYSGSPSLVGSLGSYWSSSLFDSSRAYYMYFDSSHVSPLSYDYRYFGFSLRAILI